MDLQNKITFKKIIILLVIAALLLWAALNYSTAITVLLNIISLFAPLIVGGCMAFIFNVLLKFFENKVFIHITNRSNPERKGGRFWRAFVRPLSLILTLVIIFGITILVIALVIPELKNSISLLIGEFPEFIDSVQEWLDETLISFGLGSISSHLPVINWSSILNGLMQFLSGEGSNIVAGATQFTTGVFSVVTNLVVGFVFSLYILLQKETLSRQSKGLVYAVFSKEKADMFYGVGRLSNDIFSKFITGQFMEAIIIGALCFVGMNLLSLFSFFEFPYSLMISVLIGFTALIPVVGAFIGTAVGAILILMQDPIQALWFVIFIIVLQQLESNLIYPRVVGKSVGLPGIWVLLAVLVGGSVYGILGVIVGVPLCSILYTLIKRAVSLKLDSKNINIDKVEAQDMRDVTGKKKLSVDSDEEPDEEPNIKSDDKSDNKSTKEIN